MEKAWLTQYPPQVPAEVDVHQFASIPALLDDSFSRFARLPAFTNLGATMSYREVDELSRQFGAWLQHEAGVDKGERVAIMLPNLLQYPVALFGALRAGAVVVNTNPLYTARELEHQLVDSGATCLVVLENFAHVADEVIARTGVRTVVTTQVGDLLHFPKSMLANFVVKHVKHMVPRWRLDGAVPLRRALEAGRGRPMDPVPLAASDLAFLQYTGGTTGVPKAAMLTHGNLVANVLQTREWVRGVLEEGVETGLVPLPMYHVFALAVVLIFMRIGAHSVLVTNPRELPELVALLRDSRATALIGVNTLYNALLNAPGIEQVDTARMKLAIGGGMAVQAAVAERWQQRFGMPIIEGYGLTECSAIVTANPLTLKAFSGTVGVPIPSTEVAILDEAGHQLPAGSEGEIAVRGPQVMAGYWNRPVETATALTLDGWLRTGDIGVMDANGYLRVIDRIKDLIVVSGFKVVPNEVEDVAMMHPGVMEVAAIGTPDERSGEAVTLVVLRKDPALSAQELIDHCRKYLTGYKAPKDVRFRDQPLPKSNIGKILRRVVRDEEGDRPRRGLSPGV
ncbi:MAG TPA: AMP-binding protein [Telluria sp.]|nr:AMP-binding protein [Telluria sp.]